MRGNIQSRLSTETPLIKDLITDIGRGEIKIPKFQRKFVWKEEQALNLLDSIANNYPVGSLLLWKTTVKLSAERNIGDFKLPETRDMVPTQYVLDGQQRITVIYSCLVPQKRKRGLQLLTTSKMISLCLIRKNIVLGYFRCDGYLILQKC